jgi:hypothetical protein
LRVLFSAISSKMNFIPSGETRSKDPTQPETFFAGRLCPSRLAGKRSFLTTKRGQSTFSTEFSSFFFGRPRVSLTKTMPGHRLHLFLKRLRTDEPSRCVAWLISSHCRSSNWSARNVAARLFPC